MELQRDREDLERPEIMEDMSEDIEETMRGERPNKRRQRGESGMDPQKKSLILGAAGEILLIILLIVFFGGGDKNAGKELDAVKTKLDALEKRLVRAEGMEQRFSSMESQIKGLQGSVNRLESQARTMKEQAEKAAQAAPPKPPQVQTPPPPKPQAQASAPQKKPSQGERHLHEVRRGETLFSIAKKFGMTPDELRRLNHLSKNDSIQLGQKLIVGGN